MLQAQPLTDTVGRGLTPEEGPSPVVTPDPPYASLYVLAWIPPTASLSRGLSPPAPCDGQQEPHSIEVPNICPGSSPTDPWQGTECHQTGGTHSAHTHTTGCSSPNSSTQISRDPIYLRPIPRTIKRAALYQGGTACARHTQKQSRTPAPILDSALRRKEPQHTYQQALTPHLMGGRNSDDTREKSHEDGRGPRCLLFATRSSVY